MITIARASGEVQSVVVQPASFENVSPVVYAQATLGLWLLVFGMQPHKEERFLFPIYPLIAMSAAVTLYSIERLLDRLCAHWRRIGPTLATLVPTLVVIFFALLSAARVVSLYRCTIA